MKKLIACLLTLVMLVGIVPAALGAESAQSKSIKVLSIGEEFSRSGFDYLYKVLEAEGYSDISVAYLNGYKDSSGTVQLGLSSITEYAAGLENEKSNYTFCNNVRDFANDMSSGYTVQMALEANDWDYIVLNTTPIQSGAFTQFSSALNTMIAYIKEYRPNAKIGWHLNWAYQEGYEGIGDTTYEKSEAAQFASVYRGNQDTMYAAIAAAAKQAAEKVDFVIPVGTAVMNMEGSYLGDVRRGKDDIVVDGSNLTELGKLVASYTWYSKLSGKKLTDLNFTDAFLVDLSAADRKVVVDAVNNAINTPYAVTASSYQTEPTQYNAVVNSTTTRHLPGETVTISTKAALNAGRKFLYWVAVDGSVTFADVTAQTTTFTMPAQDVEVKAVYVEAGDSSQLKVGFGRVDVTPAYSEYSVPMWGYNNEATREATELYSENDRLTITAVAVSDGTNTNVITTMDLLYAPKGWIDDARVKVVEKGLLKDGRDLIYSATHTHSGPVVGTKAKDFTDFAEYYYEIWMDGMLSAVETAITDLAPVSETKISITEVPGMNFNRHYRNSEGSVSSSNTTNSAGAERGIFRDCDKNMQLIRFIRDDEDKKDVVLVNWQGHAIRNSLSTTNTKLSTDYPGALRRYVEQEDGDCLVAFFLGASGNLNPLPNFLPDVGARWRVGTVKQVNSTLVSSGDVQGEVMGKYVIKMMENMTTVETGAVHSMHQDAITFVKNYGTPRTLKQEAVSIGSSIAFVTAPYEMFDRNAMDVKEASPFDITFVLTCGSANGYIPEWQTFCYPYLSESGLTAYEASSVCNAPSGTGEDLADGLIGMLDILYAK